MNNPLKVSAHIKQILLEEAKDLATIIVLSLGAAITAYVVHISSAWILSPFKVWVLESVANVFMVAALLSILAITAKKLFKIYK